jgi:thiosulfate dehydrogenase (quinone) large subunit
MLHNPGNISYILLPYEEQTVNLSRIQILILRLAIGGLFLSLGYGKIHEGWLTSPESLNSSLNNLHQHAAGPQLGYLDNVAIPYTALWSKLMAIGETAVGISLLLGLLARLSSLVGIIMVLNFHAATGNLFSLNFFGSPWACLLLAGLLVLFLARAGRWGGVDALLSKSNPKGSLW